MTTTAAFSAARSRYATSSVTTASPARLLTMLYDRLVRDLVTAEACLAESNIATANDNLQHAQAIILELRTSLDTKVWSGGPGLAALYTFLHEELTTANIEKSLPRVVSCREIIEPLRDAWHQAAAQDLALRGA
jgi:flagellar protein FliS